MSDSEFSALKREELTAVARDCYDREAARRGLTQLENAQPDRVLTGDSE